MALPLSIYIHWPFCKSKCPYCDFNSHVREGVDHARWRAALLRELEHYASLLEGRQVASIFFGGGTPSLMEPETVAALIEAVKCHWPQHAGMEITLEANPTSVEAAKFKALRAAGVNRVSLGVQSLLPQSLAFLGRQHSADEALAAVALARECFPRMSFDLIYALPGQSLAAWETELRAALAHAADHLSLYQLTIEENTAFHHSYHQGAFALPEDTLAADMYILTQTIMEAHGMPAYEVSNHARPGQESRHNLAYWKSDDYIGIGPGAHGRYAIYNASGSGLLASAMKPGSRLSQSTDCAIMPVRIATETLKSPERWLEKVEQSGSGISVETLLSPREQFEEAVMMGLRLSGGIEYADWQVRTGMGLREVLPQSQVDRLRSQGMLVADEQHITVTPQGRLLLNTITKALLADSAY
jgi:oxygen-independent coproporphyrinogen-3 oxidase